MFGFSLQKLLVLAAIVAAVWYGFRFLGQVQAARKAEERAQARRPGWRERMTGRAKKTPAAEAEDMVVCPVCQAYVSARNPSNCGRAGCPY